MSRLCDEGGFLQELLNCQRGLYTYIFKLLLDPSEAQDVLQETNLVLLKKQEEYPRIRDFRAWAARIAYYQVLAHRKKKQRDRHVFNDEVVEQLAHEGIEELRGENRDLQALGHCLENLSARDRDLLEKRYVGNLSARGIGELVGRSARAISQALYRIRVTLMHCIDEVLASGDRI